MRQMLAEHFRVLSFTTFDADGDHFQSFVLEKPGTGTPQLRISGMHHWVIPNS
jgi:hypothetical protein